MESPYISVIFSWNVLSPSSCWLSRMTLSVPRTGSGCEEDQQIPASSMSDAPLSITCPPTAITPAFGDSWLRSFTVGHLLNRDLVWTSPYAVPYRLTAYARIWYFVSDCRPVSRAVK
ncbi:hypothetical protein Barb7_02361 [Bacteroidales bacterium Barb7]|nr:hypothetical protein Barb7_02361 [Bacteroidales bacterium Barb7]